MNKRGIIVTHLRFRYYIFILVILVILILGYNFYSKIPKSCPNNLIPDRLNVTCLKKSGELCNLGGNWNDGVEIIDLYPGCVDGTKSGQNINYLYCNAKYENTPIDASGNLQDTIKVIISLVLDKRNYTTEKVFNYDTYETRDFKVISYSCR